MSKFDEPEPGAVSGAVAEPHQVSVGWNSVTQLAAILGLYAATFFLLDATASPACLFAATALPVAFGGLALYGPCPVGSSGSCFQYVPMGAAMLAAIAFLFMGFRSMTTGLEKYFGWFSVCCLRCDCSACCDFTFGFDNAATAGPSALVPCFFLQLPSLRFQLSLLYESEPAFQEGYKLSSWRMTRLWMTWRQTVMCRTICSSCLCTMRLLRSWCLPWMIPLSALRP